jgi:hypothetical protein
LLFLVVRNGGFCVCCGGFVTVAVAFELVMVVLENSVTSVLGVLDEYSSSSSRILGFDLKT